MDDFIHQYSFKFINGLNSSLSEFHNQNPAYGDLSFQIILHIISCTAAIRDVLEGGDKKSTMANQIFHPFLNGLLGTLGKILLDTFTIEPKLQETNSYNATFAMILRHSLRLFPDIALKRHKTSGKLLLHHAVLKAKQVIAEDSIRTILAISPETAAVPDVGGALALHWATRNLELGSEVIDLLVQVNPESPQIADLRGYLPLHWCVNQDSVNLEILRKLLKLHPEGAAKPTLAGQLPLHCCVDHDKPNINAIKALLQVYPQALKAKCEEGYLPLHRLVHRAVIDTDSLRYLIQQYPDALIASTINNQTPLHLALDNPYPDHTNISLMVSQQPLSCSIADEDGYMPLHMVLDCASPNYLLAEQILHAFPQAAHFRTNDGMLPLHLMISSNEDPAIPFAKQLIEINPEACSSQVRDILPAIDGVAMVDPDSWSGEWVEKEWTPFVRANERGLYELANLINNTLNKIKSGGFLPTAASSHNENASKLQEEIQTPFLPAIKQSQPIRVVDNDLSLKSPAKFTLNRPLATPASSRPEQDTSEVLPFQTELVNAERPSTTPALQLDRPLSARNISLSSTQPVMVDNYLENNRVPPPNKPLPSSPIPTNLLQAAENNTMRLSKAQYEFLKGGGKVKKPKKVKKAAIVPDSSDVPTDASDSEAPKPSPQRIPAKLKKANILQRSSNNLLEENENKPIGQPTSPPPEPVQRQEPIPNALETQSVLSTGSATSFSRVRRLPNNAQNFIKRGPQTESDSEQQANIEPNENPAYTRSYATNKTTEIMKNLGNTKAMHPQNVASPRDPTEMV